MPEPTNDDFVLRAEQAFERQLARLARNGPHPTGWPGRDYLKAIFLAGADFGMVEASRVYHDAPNPSQ